MQDPKNKEMKLQINSQGLFDETHSYISGLRMYFSYFKIIPNIKEIDTINAKRLRKWFEIEYKGQIYRIHSKECYHRYSRKMKHEKILYLIKNNFILEIEHGTAILLFDPARENEAQHLINQMKKFLTRRTSDPEILLIIRDKGGLETRHLSLKKRKLDLDSNYNDDLIRMNTHILENLKKENKSGLILFHGVPGTGKTTYIRQLIPLLKKRVLFLPPKMAGNLENPELVNLLLFLKNSVLIIEDAEELLISRENGNHSGISMLLNLTDGILGEGLGIQIIATFNTKISNIDTALLRKGRLTALYEFKPLTIDKSKLLLNKLGNKNYNVTAPMTLAEIYNLQDEQYEFNPNQKRTIGFLSEAV
jgi:hypothetical protein